MKYGGGAGGVSGFVSSLVVSGIMLMSGFNRDDIK